MPPFPPFFGRRDLGSFESILIICADAMRSADSSGEGNALITRSATTPACCRWHWGVPHLELRGTMKAAEIIDAMKLTPGSPVIRLQQSSNLERERHRRTQSDSAELA